jgi:hypothetical protein
MKKRYTDFDLLSTELETKNCSGKHGSKKLPPNTSGNKWRSIATANHLKPNDWQEKPNQQRINSWPHHAAEQHCLCNWFSVSCVEQLPGNETVFQIQ